MDNTDCDLKNGHQVWTISLRGKPDSVYVDCHCGAGECIGVWFQHPPKGWDPNGWHLIMDAIKKMLDYNEQI
jgi:hypothetical protein